ncbi:MAG: radical SAM/SPASM domain protein, ACGX system [Clostridia bacterium]|nr:radical SAM/SPASM domain protein, ACGX system [Clostridia bacterium]
MREYFAFQWHITDSCDQRCKHCYIYAGDAHHQVETQSWQQMQKILSNCEDFCQVFQRLPYFYITGGDPLLHPDFWKLLAKLKTREIPFAILGNPFHLNDAVCRKLRDYGCQKYQLSLDGMRDTHDWFRKPGSFDLTLEKIETLKRAGIRAVIMSTVSAVNIDEIPDVIEAAASAGADVFSFARFVPTGFGIDEEIEPYRYRSFLTECDNRFRALEEAGCQTYFDRKDHLWTLYAYEQGSFRIPDGARAGMIYGGCNCGNCHLTITASGDVMACRRAAGSRVGSACTDRLSDLWIRELEAYREYEQFEKCSKCELLAWCRGCPAVAGAGNGNFYAADPQCWKELPPAGTVPSAGSAAFQED